VVPALGFESVTVKVSAPSGSASSFIATAIGLEVDSPLAQLSVPETGSKSWPEPAVPGEVAYSTVAEPVGSPCLDAVRVAVPPSPAAASVRALERGQASGEVHRVEPADAAGCDRGVGNAILARDVEADGLVQVGAEPQRADRHQGPAVRGVLGSQLAGRRIDVIQSGRGCAGEIVAVRRRHHVPSRVQRRVRPGQRPIGGFRRRFCSALETDRMRSVRGFTSVPQAVPLRVNRPAVPTCVAAPVRMFS
jgi:hypothetical protein